MEAKTEQTLSDRVLLSARDLQKMGLSRAMAYKFLNRDDMPVIVIAGRKFMHRDMFLDWLKGQTNTAKGA